MTTTDIQEKLWPKILKYIALKPRSQKEVVDRLFTYLRKFEISDGDRQVVADTIVADLKQENFINDEKYAQEVALSIRNSTKSRGKHYIKRLLTQKGISGGFVESVINQTDDLVEYENALLLGQKKFKTLKYKNLSDAKNKLWQHLIYRGYESDIIGRVIDNVLGVK